MDVGFLGLGPMGQAIALNLLQGGASLTVWNRTPERVHPLVAAGAVAAGTPAEAAGRGVLVTMLANDAALEGVLDDVLAALPAGGVHVCMATISTALSRRLTALHAARAQHFVAAPVLGRPAMARAAALTVLVAGRAEAVERVRPLLAATARDVKAVGDDPAAAHLLKLALNFAITGIVEIVAEIAAVTEAAGIATDVTRDILTGTIFSTPLLTQFATLVADRRYGPGEASVALATKDNRAFRDAAAAVGVEAAVADLIASRLHELGADAAGLDYAAIAMITRRNAGLRP